MGYHQAALVKKAVNPRSFRYLSELRVVSYVVSPVFDFVRAAPYRASDAKEDREVNDGKKKYRHADLPCQSFHGPILPAHEKAPPHWRGCGKLNRPPPTWR